MKQKRTVLIIEALGLLLFAQAAQAQWTTAKRLTWTSGASMGGSIAVDSQGRLHVIWSDETPGNGEIYYKKSTDGGITWTPSRRLTWTAGGSYGAALAVDSLDHLHVAWQDETPGNVEIFYKKSTDGGDTWTANKRLTFNAGNSYQPDLAVDSSDCVHMVWSDATPGNCEVYYRRSTDGGDTWTVGQRLTWTTEWSGSQAMAVDSSDILHAVWDDYVPGNAEIFYKKSTNGGATWLPTQRLSWTSGSSFYPDIAVDSSGNLFVVWPDYTQGNGEICYKRSTDGGASWVTGRRLSLTPGDSSGPVLAVDSLDNVHVVWQDETPGNYEIYYKKSTDGGAGWTAGQRLSWTSGDSFSPAIASDSGNTLHVVWEDHTPGNYEIYYLRGK
jgi:hypothetical protein